MIPPLGPDGLLPAGAHRATLSDVRRTFVNPSLGDAELRAAVFSGITTLATTIRRRIGPGLCLVGGGFVSRGEAGDAAILVYQPDDDAVAELAVKSGAAADLVSLKGVVYSYPGGGGVPERWPVSGLVDAHLSDRVVAPSYRNALARVIGPDGTAQEGVTKGYVEVEVGPGV